MTENVIVSLFDPHMIPWGKMKIPNPYCTSARQTYHILEVQLSTPESVVVVQVTNFTEKWKRFSSLIRRLGIK